MSLYIEQSSVPDYLVVFPLCAVVASSFWQLSLSEAASESVAEARRVKRQRKLDQVEIPADHLSITDELLGKGGFGEVYLADYNGHNAAAKVWNGFAILNNTTIGWFCRMSFSRSICVTAGNS